MSDENNPSSENSEEKYITCYHTHSTQSDGKYPISEIYEHAKKVNLTRIGISDHYRLGPDKLHTKNGIVNLDHYVTDYVKNFSMKKDPLFMLGVEADFFPETAEALRKDLSPHPWDYIIGAVHFVIDEGLNLPEQYMKILFESNLTKERKDEYIKLFWFRIRQLAESGLFDIVAHMDLSKRSRRHSQEEFSEEVNSALDAIKKANMTVELNTSGWYHPCNEQYPSIYLLQKCYEKEIPIIVTSDAHYVDHLVRGFEKAYEILRKVGYKKLAYYVKRKRYFAQIPKK